MIVTLPNDKKDEVIDMASQLQNSLHVTIRKLSSFIGSLVASSPAVKYGPAFYRYLEMDKINARKKSRGNFEYVVSLSLKARDEIK